MGWYSEDKVMTKLIVGLSVFGVVVAAQTVGASRLVASDAASRANPAVPSSSATTEAEQPPALAAALGVAFVENSTSTLTVERDGKRYLVDLAARTISEVSSDSVPAASALKPTAPTSKAPEQAASAQAPKKKKLKVYEPGDDYVFTLPTGRRLDRHGFYINFNHRFAFESAFEGPAKGATLLGLDNYSISSFGFRYGVTDKVAVGFYRSPTTIARPIEFWAGYNFTDERDGHPVNTMARISVDGQDSFSKNYSTNFELIVSRSITSRAQIYFVPTFTVHNRRLYVPNYPGPINELPCVPANCANSFSIGVAGSFDIRPTVALVAEINPMLSGRDSLGVHRPPFSFGIQKKIWRHAFAFGFTNAPGTTVSQRSGTRAAFLNSPSADTPGLFVAFDLTRQIY